MRESDGVNMDRPPATIVWQGRETYRPLRHRIESRIYVDMEGVRWRKEMQEVRLVNATLRREETIKHQAAYLEHRTPFQVVERRLKCGPYDRVIIVVEKLYHTDGIRVLIRMRNCETGEEKYFRRNESRDDDKVFNLVHGAKFAIGETIGHTSLPDTVGNMNDILKNFPADPEQNNETAWELLTEQTNGWLADVACAPPVWSARSSPTLLPPSKLPSIMSQSRSGNRDFGHGKPSGAMLRTEPDTAGYLGKEEARERPSSPERRSLLHKPERSPGQARSQKRRSEQAYETPVAHVHNGRTPTPEMIIRDIERLSIGHSNAKEPPILTKGRDHHAAATRCPPSVNKTRVSLH